MAKRFEILGKITNGAASVAGAAIIALVVIQVLIVVLRYIFSFGLSWGLDLLIYLFLVASLLPLPLVIWENQNVRVDIFYHNYRSRTKALLDRLGLAFLLFPAAGYTAYISWGPMLNSWRLHEASPTLDGLPGYYLLKTILFLTFASLSLISLICALKKRPWKYADVTEPEQS